MLDIDRTPPMALTEQITRLRSECLSALDASHNYYAHTAFAWRLVQKMVRQGQKFSIRNQVTGDKVNESELTALAQDYSTGYLVSATFQQFVSLFERFVFDFLRAWLAKYPASLARSELQFQAVLDATDKNEIVGMVVQREVGRLAYKRVADWFEYLERIARLGTPTPDQIQRLAEIKASRDILVHHNGIVNAIYVRKSAAAARFADGDILEIPEPYHRDAWQLIREVVSEISDAAINKLEG